MPYARSSLLCYYWAQTLCRSLSFLEDGSLLWRNLLQFTSSFLLKVPVRSSSTRPDSPLLAILLRSPCGPGQRGSCKRRSVWRRSLGLLLPRRSFLQSVCHGPCWQILSHLQFLFALFSVYADHKSRQKMHQNKQVTLCMSLSRGCASSPVTAC